MTNRQTVEALREALCLEQAQRQLATETHRCAYCNYQATGANAFDIVTEHIKSCPAHPLAKALAELAQARANLKDLQGANRSFARQLDDVTENREFWYKEARDAENKRDEVKDELGFVRQAMQEQSDEVQELWLSPAEAEGLKRQLGLLQSAIDNLCEQNERQIDMEDCGRHASYPSKFPEWEAAWEQAYELRYDSSDAAAKLADAEATQAEFTVHKELLNELARGKLERRIEATAKLAERLATLDAAEAALAECGIAGIYDQFSSPADAIKQMVERLVQLEGGQALQHERTLRQVAETGEQAARKLLSQAIVAQADAELAAHVHSKACDELTQTMHTERRLRQKAECERDDISGNLRRMVELNEWSRNELDRMGQRAERAEALAQLMTEETAALLERLGTGWTATLLDDGNAARALAARIREALAMEAKEKVK